MEHNDRSPDLQDYWNEYKSQELKISDDENQPKSLDDDGPSEAEWLVLAGLSHLTDKYLSGEEIEAPELANVERVFSYSQADAVRKRVTSLNHTIRHRNRAQRNRKPDIRDVFKDYQIPGTRANVIENKTVENPDSITVETPLSSTCADSLPNVYERYQPIERRSKPPSPPLHFWAPTKELFRKNARYEGDIVASENAYGITMLGFHKLGTIRDKSSRHGYGSSDNIVEVDDCGQPASLPYIGKDSRSDECLLKSSRRNRDIDVSFESVWSQPNICEVGDTVDSGNKKEEDADEEELVVGRTWVDTLSEGDLDKLSPLFFVEVSAIFDKHGLPIPRIKHRKRSPKGKGTIFGVSLAGLIKRDILSSNEKHFVPRIFQLLISEINSRGLNEQGILRVGGNKMRTEQLCQEMERHFYSRPAHVQQLLQRASVHELTTVLKKLLRELPSPLLTSHLINFFYKCHCIPRYERVLNLLVLLLPVENRRTLLSILSLMRNIVAHQNNNKMNQHNVAMIIAPSLFPPRYIQNGDSGKSCDLKAQIGVAAVSCHIVETLMSCGERLSIVPPSFISQLRHINDISPVSPAPTSKKMFKKPAAKSVSLPFVDLKEDLSSCGDLRVNATQFNVSAVQMPIAPHMTAGDVVLRTINIGKTLTASSDDNYIVRGGAGARRRAVKGIQCGGNLSCLLSTADPDTALSTHFLYEHGGNIGQRRIEPTAMVSAIYEQNPRAQWNILCDHRNAIKNKN